MYLNSYLNFVSLLAFVFSIPRSRMSRASFQSFLVSLVSSSSLCTVRMSDPPHPLLYKLYDNENNESMRSRTALPDMDHHTGGGFARLYYDYLPAAGPPVNPRAAHSFKNSSSSFIHVSVVSLMRSLLRGRSHLYHHHQQHLGTSRSPRHEAVDGHGDFVCISWVA